VCELLLLVLQRNVNTPVKARERNPAAASSLARLLFAGVGTVVLASLPGIGYASDRSESDRDPVEASLDLTQLGVVTWLDGRVDVPIASGISVFPQGALLHVASQGQVSQEEWHPFAGAGIAWGPSDPWHIELGGLYAPPSDDIESESGELEIERDFDSDGGNKSEPGLELNGTLSVQHVRWEDGRGPTGRDIVQAYVEAEPVWRPTPRWVLSPHAMGFAYDHDLGLAAGNRIGSVSVLARVGTFAPLALAGATVGYAFLRWLTPKLSASEIVYAANVGDATEATVGARVRVSHGLTVSASGGWLWNRVSGPLVPSYALRSLPVANVEIVATF
jgi:hypothetical protein